MNIVYNKMWRSWSPRVSIITPVYNRRIPLQRAMLSVENQKYSDIEHIIINDGSDDNIEDIMNEYMLRVNYPVAYIDKPNGGVHTARNAGIKISRGEMMIFLDSDDELMPYSIQTFIDAWDSIPRESRDDYRECNAFCVDEKGKRIGGYLPRNINEILYSDAIIIVDKEKKGEKVGFYRADLMRDNLWPEPEGVKQVTEDIIWCQLAARYKTWFLNDELRIYHTESGDSLTKKGTRDRKQNLINAIYNSLWFINNGEKYRLSKKEIIKQAIVFSTFRHILKWKYRYPAFSWASEKVKSVVLRCFLVIIWLPSLLYSFYNQYKYYKQS